MRDTDRRYHRHAADHHGVVWLEAARGFGVPDATFWGRVRRGLYLPLTGGGWIIDGVPATWESTVLGAVAALGDGAVASHAAALRLHGLLRPAPRAAIEVTLPHRRRHTVRPGVVVHRSRVLPADSLTTVQSIPTTTAVRALRDMASRLSDRRLRNLVIDAQQGRLVDMEALVREARRRPTAAGAARFGRVVRGRLRDTSDSGFEADVRKIVRAAGWMVSNGPVPFEVRPGLVLHADLALTDHPVVIECDGWGYHRDRVSFGRDRGRWELFEDAGLEIAWITHDLLDEPSALVDRVRRAVTRSAGAVEFAAVRLGDHPAIG